MMHSKKRKGDTFDVKMAVLHREMSGKCRSIKHEMEMRKHLIDEPPTRHAIIRPWGHKDPDHKVDASVSSTHRDTVKVSEKLSHSSM